MDNCALIYLKTGNIDTASKISERLGTYTCQSYGESSNSNKNDSSSSSMSLISRKLLTPDEVLMIENPYALVMLAGKPPAITTIPDISQIHFNKLNAMGTKEENQTLRIEREQKRKEKPMKPIKIWDIWNRYLDREDELYDIEQIRHNLEVMRKDKNENKKGTNQEDL